jgi:hypothetical protein
VLAAYTTPGDPGRGQPEHISAIVNTHSGWLG